VNVKPLLTSVLIAPLLWGRAAAAAIFTPDLEVLAEERYDDEILLREVNNGNGATFTKVGAKLGLTAKQELWNLEAWYAPDLLFQDLTGNTELEHRGRFKLAQTIGPMTEWKGDLQLWRVTDPTALPRIGIGRTLDPIFYVSTDLGLRHELSRRTGLRVSEHFELAKIDFQSWEVAPATGTEPTGLLGGVSGTCGPETVNPNTHAAVACIPAYQTAPGFVNAPSGELYWKANHRWELAAGERVQFFNFGPEFGVGNGPYARSAYMVTRETTFNFTAGPVWFNQTVTLQRTTEGNYINPASGEPGLVPRINAELTRHGPQLDWSLAAGHDLVGASGFTNVLWADFAALFATYRLTGLPLSVTAGGSYYRNGQTPNQGAWPAFSVGAGVAAGYAVEAELEWKLSHKMATQLVYNRLTQVGEVYAGAQPNLSRNIIALRLRWEAL
jgi:hypothetical protein